MMMVGAQEGVEEGMMVVMMEVGVALIMGAKEGEEEGNCCGSHSVCLS